MFTMPTPRFGMPFKLVLLVVLTVLSTRASAAPVVIDFEDLGNQVTVFDQYANKGISFNYPLVLDYSKEAAPWRYQGFAHSGTKAIEQCYGKEFCSTPIVMNFTTPQKRVKVWAGYSDNLTTPRTVVLTTLDSAGGLIHQQKATFQPSSAPLPIQTSLEDNSGTQNIHSATVSFAPGPDGRPPDTNHLAIDDIEFDTPGPPPICPSTTNPVVTLTQPTSGQILRSNSFSIQGTVDTTSPLDKAEVIVSGSSGTNRLDLLSGGAIPYNGGAFSAYGITDLLLLGSNTITVRVQNCKGPGESSTTLIYQPCDNTTRPKVIINEPNPSAYTTISSDTFKLQGKIDSPGTLQTVSVTVVPGMPSTESHQFNITPDNNGAFDVQLSSLNLFKGNNTITVTAQSSDGCPGEASTTVTYDKKILRRISGQSFLQFAQADPQDKYKAENGFLHVTHNPGCGLKGNNGDDKFFPPEHNLPFWAKYVKYEFVQFWPKERKQDDCGVGGWFGAGSYLTRVTQGDQSKKEPLLTVHWENACCGQYGGKNIEYVVSFIVSVSEDLVQAGQSLGEPMFDPDQLAINSIAPPNGFSLNQQPVPTPPPQPSGSGKLTIDILFDTQVPGGGPYAPYDVTAWVQGTGPVTGTVGDTSFKINETQKVTPPSVGKWEKSIDNLRAGNWSISVVCTETGNIGSCRDPGNGCTCQSKDPGTGKPVCNCQASVPGTIVFDFSGNQGLRCTTSPY